MQHIIAAGFDFTHGEADAHITAGMEGKTRQASMSSLRGATVATICKGRGMFLSACHCMLHHNQADIQKQMMAAWAAEYTSVTICITKHRSIVFDFFPFSTKTEKGRGS